ncbi:MAG: class F sortase [Sphingomonadaceae bacterium]
MKRIGSGLLVVAVLLLIAASYPAPVAVGHAAKVGAEGQRPTDVAGAGAREASRIQPWGSVEGTEQKEKEANEILVRLKPKPGPKPHEPAVELPRQIRIPAIGVDAGFEYVGLAADGAMDVPKDGNNVAWYRLGPKPGEPGNAVVAGHVDWGGKTAVFWELGSLKAGDLVEITATDGRKYEYVVQWLRWYDADDAPVEEVFGQSDGYELTLITCGGDFDRRTRQYLKRLVVRATLR